MDPVDILIMAAGTSSRFGGCKLLADWQGAPLITRSLTAAQEIFRSSSNIVSVNLVVGGHAEAIQTATAASYPRVKTHFCRDWAQGLGRSIAYGVSQLATTNSVLVMLADQPLIGARDLEALLSVAHQFPEKIICAEFSSTLGVPALFPSRFKIGLRQLKGDKGAKALLLSSREELVAVSMPHAALDIDTAEDLHR